MEKDLAKTETNDNESTPLMTEVKKETVSYTTTQVPLSSLATELSELSLETTTSQATSQATTASVVDDNASEKQKILESQTSEESHTSSTATDAVEDMSVDQPVDVSSDDRLSVEPNHGDSTPNIDSSPLEEECETETPLDSESSSVDMWKMDRTMFMLILEVLLLAFPISMMYYGIAYFKSCPGGDKLPALLIVFALFSSLTLISRILINVAEKGQFYDRNVVPENVVHVGDFLVIVMFVAEVAYIFKTNWLFCNNDLYEYVFYMNNIAALFILCLLISGGQKLVRCCQILRQ